MFYLVNQYVSLLGKRCLLFAIFVANFGGGLCGGCDMLQRKNESQPMFGHVIESNEENLIFEPFGGSERIDMKRRSIDVLVINIDRQRLQRLQPPHFDQYRDYAEELATQRRDPAARELAIRLFIIAAAHGSPSVSESAVRGLIELADHAEERKRWAMLLLLTANRSLSTEQSNGNLDRITDADRNVALTVVRMVRRGQGSEAVKILNRPATSDSLKHWGKICSEQEIRRMARLNRPTVEQIRRLLQLEVSLINRDTAEDLARQSLSKDWSSVARAPSSLGGAMPSFRHATDFDPDKSIYRNGVWSRPGPSPE
jgi:hypothetical protein